MTVGFGASLVLALTATLHVTLTGAAAGGRLGAGRGRAAAGGDRGGDPQGGGPQQARWVD